MNGEGQCAIMDAIGRILTLEAVSGGLTWAGDGAAKLKANSIALDQARQHFARPDALPEVSGMYRACEDFCGVFVHGAIDGDVGRVAFLWAAVDYIAREADQVARGDVCNASGFAYRYGEDGTAALLAVLRGSAGRISAQHRRAETDDEDDNVITAPVGTDDERFEEASYMRCAADAEHATLITVMDVDEDAMWTLADLVEAKDAAARRAMRAAPVVESEAVQ
jgi:hypothetical protein